MRLGFSRVHHRDFGFDQLHDVAYGLDRGSMKLRV